jgi:hypothetical protein
MDEWCRDDSLHINFEIGRFDLNDNMKFTQICYCIFIYNADINSGRKQPYETSHSMKIMEEKIILS